MVNDDKKTEFLLRYQELCDKIDEDYEKIVKKDDASLKKILKECDELISYIDRERYDLMVFHGQNLSKEINWSEILKGIGLHSGKIIKLAYQVKKITQKGTCQRCKNNLDSKLFVYFISEEKVKGWVINKTVEGKWDTPVFFFCSENCFKQSAYYQENNQSSREREREREQI